MNHVKRLVAALLVALAAAAAAAQSEAAWVEDGTFFSEGLCAFTDPETAMVGYLDKAGKVAIAPQFTGGQPFREGFAVVSMASPDSEMGEVDSYIDKSGKVVKTLEPMQEARSFSDGLAQIVTYTGKRAISSYVDKNFEQVFNLPYEYDFGGSFNEGLAWVSVGDMYSGPMTYGFIDRKGELVIPGDYSSPDSFDGGIALVMKGGSEGGWLEDGTEVPGVPGDCYIIDTKGAVLREIKSADIESIEGPRDGVVIHHAPDGLVRAYGPGGAQLFETRAYEHVFPFSDGLALAIKREPSLEGKDPMPYSYGYLDKKGKVAIPFATPLGIFSRYSDGLYAYFDFDSGLVGFKDRSGKVVIAPVLSPALASNEGY